MAILVVFLAFYSFITSTMNADTLKIAMIQASLHWEDKAQNLNMFAERIDTITKGQDLIVLPEMFTTGFSMKPEVFAEPMEGDSLIWMKEQAQNNKVIIVGSMMIKEDGRYYNRLIWMMPDGSYEYYDKRHLFRLVNEQDHYTAGVDRKIVNIRDWRINLNICYDLRFPVWSRNKEDYDLLLNIANWPAKRNLIWKTLLRARSIENMCYTIGLNRVGNDGTGLYHSGDSAAVHPDGTTIAECTDEEKTIFVELSKSELLKFRDRFQFYKDADKFTIPKE